MSLVKLMTIEVKRLGSPINVRGKMERSEDVTFKIKGNLQPERNLTYIRETFGGHIEEALKIYTVSDLVARKDQIYWSGKYYEVTEVRAYSTGILDHYKIIAILVKDDTGRN